MHFIFFGFKITAGADYSHEIKKYLLLRRKAVTNLDSILKRGGKKTQKNYTKKLVMTWITIMVWSLRSVQFSSVAQ